MSDVVERAPRPISATADLSIHHANNGLAFARLPESGAVRVGFLSDLPLPPLPNQSERQPWAFSRAVDLSAEEWASVVAHVSAAGENAGTWNEARAFHLNAPRVARATQEHRLDVAHTTLLTLRNILRDTLNELAAVDATPVTRVGIESGAIGKARAAAREHAEKMVGVPLGNVQGGPEDPLHGFARMEPDTADGTRPRPLGLILAEALEGMSPPAGEYRRLHALAAEARHAGILEQHLEQQRATEREARTTRA